MERIWLISVAVFVALLVDNASDINVFLVSDLPITPSIILDNLRGTISSSLPTVSISRNSFSKISFAA